MTKRNKYGMYTSIAGAVINAVIGFLKFFIGLTSNSVSILSDGINNLGDVLSNAGSALSIGISGKKPTKKHPYGFGKAEDIATLFVSSILVIVGILFVYNSLDRLIYRRPVYFSWLYFGLILGTLVIKVVMAIGYRIINKSVNSTVLSCLTVDNYLDSGITAVALIGYGISQVTGFPLDAIIGIAIGIFVVTNGIKYLVQTVSRILGEVNTEATERIAAVLNNADIKYLSIYVLDNNNAVIKIQSLMAKDLIITLKNNIKNLTGYNVFLEITDEPDN